MERSWGGVGAVFRTGIKPPFQFHPPFEALSLEKNAKTICLKRVRAMRRHGTLQAVLRPRAAIMSGFVIAFSQMGTSQWLRGMQLLGAPDVYKFDT